MSKEIVLEMHNAGASPMEIHRDSGIALSTIYQTLAEVGLKPNRSGELAKQEREEEIIKAYEAGETVQAICVRFQASSATVYAALARRKIKIGRRRYRNEERYKKAVTMYMDGATVAAIMAETGLAAPQIYQELYRSKVELRTKGGKSA